MTKEELLDIILEHGWTIGRAPDRETVNQKGAPFAVEDGDLRHLSGCIVGETLEEAILKALYRLNAGTRFNSQQRKDLAASILCGQPAIVDHYDRVLCAPGTCIAQALKILYDIDLEKTERHEDIYSAKKEFGKIIIPSQNPDWTK